MIPFWVTKMETDIQRFERLCREAGIPSTTTNFYIDSPDRIYKFYRAIIKDISKELQMTIERKQPEPEEESEKEEPEQTGTKEEPEKKESEKPKPAKKKKIEVSNFTDRLILSKLERYKDKKSLTTRELSNLCKVSLRTIQKRTKKLYENGLIRMEETDGQARTYSLY